MKYYIHNNKIISISIDHYPLIIKGEYEKYRDAEIVSHKLKIGDIIKVKEQLHNGVNVEPVNFSIDCSQFDYPSCVVRTDLYWFMPQIKLMRMTSIPENEILSMLREQKLQRILKD